ncbi:hybrid sensor histidine kinase/response regulator transcription factor [Flavilitoribacter nigricans]|uniref:hybrid sensor histidine kinase/response regulator transcription factor n=1 Tax=Flavilitoribacter nigricans TaxID=70997 RepID=UPI0014757DC4|nr:two-component regulator propeller domain-containing protein [Flavilitoribacter nigricans]
MKKSYWYVILSLFLFSSGFAQTNPDDYFTRHYLFQERLGQGLVFDIIQDKFGFLWFGTEYGLTRYDGHQQETFQHEPNNPNSLAGNVITAIAEDSLGNLWVGTMYSGLHYFDRTTGTFHRYQYDPADEFSIRRNKINHITVQKNGSVWIATAGGGLQLYEPRLDRFRNFPQPKVVGSNPSVLFEDPEGQLWLGSYFGLCKWDPVDSVFTEQVFLGDQGHHLRDIARDDHQRLWTGFQNGGLRYLDTTTNTLRTPVTDPAWPSGEPQNYIWKLHFSRNRNLWVGTDSGLFLVELDDPNAPLRLSTYTFTEEDRFLSICESRDGVVWIGTNDGVVVLIPRQKPFDHYYVKKAGAPLEDKRGVPALAGRGDQIWIGSNEGLFQFDKERKKVHQDFLTEHPLLSRFNHDRFASLHLDRNKHLWLAVIKGFDADFEFYRYDLTRKELTNFTGRSELFSSFATMSMAEDPDGSLWFGTHNGLIHYIPQLDTLEIFQHDSNRPTGLSSNRINQLLLTHPDSLWIGTSEAGLSFYDLRKEMIFNQSGLFKDSSHIYNQRIITMLRDKSGIWLGSAGGLMHFHPADPSIHNYDKTNGLGDNVVKSLFAHQDQIWIGSKSALSRFDRKRKTFTNFTTSDGLVVKEFWERSGYQDEEGYLYLGGDEGIQVFHPDSIRDNPYRPRVVFTKFLLFNERIQPDPDHKILQVPLYQTPTIRLRHDQNVFTIHFAGLSFINSEKNQYAVRMEGFKDEWQYLGQKTEATYTNLDPGTYYFEVTATNNDGISSETPARLKFVVLPPWHATWWAYLIYILGLSSAIYFLYRFQLNRRLADAETERLRELDIVKTQLYTNITHEFRTPLTLIQGPVDKALHTPSFVLGRTDLEKIRQNCRRLLHLIHQMLHLSKLEAGALAPAYTYMDILPTVKYIVDSFSSFAESQGVDLKLHAPDEPVFMDTDSKKLVDILSNLVSNAIKFTPGGGKVRVRVNADREPEVPQLVIKVEDTGTGIPQHALEKIFDRFYQVERPNGSGKEESIASGSGIGLALSKKLAELMEGNIFVESTLGKGSSFRLILPIRATKKETGSPVSFPEIYIPKQTEQSGKDAPKSDEVSENAPMILIVEDNADVAEFVAESLLGRYQCHICRDGAEGVEWATEHIPDLIISDVLMPRMNGYKLTKQLKGEQKTSHIPIILLTAKADLPSKIIGFERGADAYMAKPFNSRELLIRIKNLLESRRRLQQHYLLASGMPVTEPEEAQASTQEQIFLQEVRQLIEENLEKGDYSIESLAGDLYMSSAQLYRKMMALTGLSPSKFYRNIQISKARQLLQDTELSISEIAYQCGFNDPAYFSRVFSTELKENPTSYRVRYQ